MSSALQAILTRAVMDEQFRIALTSDPDGATQGMDLTSEERAQLGCLRDKLDTFAEALDRQIGKMALSNFCVSPG